MIRRVFLVYNVMNGIPSIPKIFAFIQARLGSTRYPNKVLNSIPVKGRTLLEHIHSRLKTTLSEEQIVFLIPEEDQSLLEYLKEKSFNYYCGSLNDVRKRFRDASNFYQADVILRLTGDNPFVDTKAIETIIEAWHVAFNQNTKLDLIYYSPLPLGMGIESFSRQALDKSSEIDEQRHLEHVSLHIKENPKDYTILKMPSPFPESIASLRLTFDEELDYQTLLNIYEEAISNSHNEIFGAFEIYNLSLKNPELFNKNQIVEQVRFNLPKPQVHSKRTICIIIGNPREYGSGHWERMTILSIKLVLLGYEVSMQFNSTKITQEFDYFIIDSREDYSDAKFLQPILRIDELSKKRKNLISEEEYFRLGFVDLLPHPDSFGWSAKPQVLLSNFANQSLSNIQILNSSNRIKETNTLLCYAGNLNSECSKSLDDFLISKYSNNKIIRIGGSEPITMKIHYEVRLTKRKWWNYLSKSDYFLSYFGQGLMEAMYLRKKLASYSIGDYHTMLSRHIERIWSVPFLGDCNQEMEFLEFSNSYPIIHNTAHERIIQWLESQSSTV
ncbi:MAG: hypothetical protein MH321_11370 [Leptospiraceae bacterium]|nr:hypothetical protein [Leptospiraceae bacterium]